MADSIDRKAKKSKISRDSDPDALLDEAELSVTPVDDSQEDEDAIDRLLMDAGFEADEKLPEMIDDTDFPAGYDEFGDDFDLADISTDLRNTAEINLADDIKTDNDFSLDLIDSIAITPDEKSNNFNATGDDDDLEVFPLHGLQNGEPEQANEEGPVIDDSSLADRLDEFSNFSEFSEVQQAGLNADDSPDSSFSALEDTSELPDNIEETPEFSGLVMDDDELIVDIAELEAIDQAIEHDEFGDDLNDPYGAASTLDFGAQTDNDQQSEAEQTTRVDNGFDVPSADYDITADFDDELIDNLDQTGALLDEQTVQEIDRQAMQATAVTDETSIGKVPEKSPDNADSQLDAAGMAALLQFKSDQEAINKKYKKQITDFETNAKKSAMITYIAVGFGVTSLITAVVMGVMAYSTKTEITKLNELAGALGKDKNGVAVIQKQHSEIAPKAELNHEADKTIEASKLKQDASQEKKPDHAAAEPIHEAENTAHDAKVLTPESPAPATSMEQPQMPPVPVKHEKPETAEESHQSEHKPVEQQKEQVEALAKKTSQSEALSTSAGSIKKDIRAVPEKKQVSEHKPVEQLERKIETVKKQKRSVITAKKAAAKKGPKALTSVSDWSVNLIAYKQQWYASSKAAQFAQKGVPVEILPVKIDNVTWYRLRVGGFNNREEASLYAGRVKKALNLSSVWVGNK